MFKFTKSGGNIIIFTIITIIFCLIQICMYQYTNEIEIETEIGQSIMNQDEISIPEQIETSSIWQIEIERISLIANISEGTTKEILNKNVGPFEETKKEEGNVGLAAHNRGYQVNYFEKLKLLQEGDEIKYRHNQFEKTYEITKNIIIEDTNFDVLENTEENMLTLITCVENEPNYRRCVQAIEKEEEKY